MEAVKPYLDQLDGYLKQQPAFVYLEKQLKVPKTHIAIAAYVLSSISLFFLILPSLVSNTIGLLLIVPETLRSLANPSANLTQSTVGLLVFGLLNLVDDLLDFMQPIPLYYVLRTAVFVYLLQYGGTLLLTSHLKALVNRQSAAKKDS